MKPSRIAALNAAIDDASTLPNPQVGASQYDGRSKSDLEVVKLEVARIEVKANIRKRFDQAALLLLGYSLKKNQKLPIIVYWSEEKGKYILEDGERRYRAALLVGLTHLDANIVPEKDAAAIIEDQLITFTHKVDLGPVERARAFDQLMKLKGWNGKQLAENIHVDPTVVTRSLELLKLPEEMQEKIDAGEMGAREAVRQAKASTGTPRGQRGGGKKRVFKVSGKGTVTVAFSRALNPELIRQALTEVVDQLGRSAAELPAIAAGQAAA